MKNQKNRDIIPINLTNACSGSTPLLPSLPALETEKPVIPIVSAFDDNFAPVFSVFLESLISSSSPDFMYDLIVLSDEISGENKKIVQSQVSKQKNLSIRFFEMQSLLINETVIHEPYFSRPTFFRLKLSSILLEYEKVIYIDPDTIVLKDLKDIYYENLNDTYAGVVRCLSTMEARLAGLHVGKPYSDLTFHDYFITEVQLPEENLHDYFNAGFMILNLHKIREDEMETQFLNLFYTKNYFLVDQDILNKSFASNITLLSNKWNVIPLSTTRKTAPLPYIYDQDYRQAVANPAIIHYAAPHNKPWLHETVPFGEIFWRYAKKSPYYEVLLKKYLESLKRPKKKMGSYLRKKVLKELIRNCMRCDLKTNVLLFKQFTHQIRHTYQKKY